MPTPLASDLDRLDLRVPPKLRAGLVRLALENDRSLSAEVRFALRRHVERQERIDKEAAAAQA